MDQSSGRTAPREVQIRLLGDSREAPQPSAPSNDRRTCSSHHAIGTRAAADSCLHECLIVKARATRSRYRAIGLPRTRAPALLLPGARFRVNSIVPEASRAAPLDETEQQAGGSASLQKPAARRIQGPGRCLRNRPRASAQPDPAHRDSGGVDRCVDAPSRPSVCRPERASAQPWRAAKRSPVLGEMSASIASVACRRQPESLPSRLAPR